MTNKTNIIKGSGGGGGSPPPPYRAPDTLHSRSFATIQDLISEGEIEGFASASKEGLTKGTTAYQNASLKDVFLGETPILASDAVSASPSDEKFNFKDVVFKSKFGTSNQTAMSGIPAESRSPSGVQVEVENDDDATTWTAIDDGAGNLTGTNYTVNQIVKSGNDAASEVIVFKCTTAGQAGTTEPAAFLTATVGQTITDGGVTWTAQTVGITGAVTRQITNTDVDAVVVTLTWPQIQVLEDDGDVRGDTVKYAIQIQHDSGGFVTKVEAQVSGRTADAYARDHRIELTSGFTTVDIRVVRITPDSTDTQRVNKFQFTSFQEVIDNSSTYPNSAYVGLRLDSKQFNRIPQRMYRIRGIKVRIPGAGASSSGTPTVDIQTGRIIYPSGYIFNGVMGAATYTNCPAMCLLDLLTNTRYGLGNHITDSNIDLFSFVAASKHSNELVDDGTGSGTQEARFSCNVNIQSPKEAFEAINDIASSMRCMPIWSAGGITLAQDKSTSASYLFNLANIGEGGFSYSGSSLKTRHSVISVAYFNMDSKEVDFEVVEDTAAIAKFGTIVKKIKAYACTSRNQAARLGRAVLFAEQNESETVSFTTSIDSGIVVRPGSVIEINDPVRAGARRGGRIVSATTSAITIDALADTTLPSLTDSPTVSVILSDGTVEVGKIGSINNAVLTLQSTSDAVSKINDQGETVTQSTFSSAPLANSPYLISSTSLQTQLFRVIQVQEQDDINYAITALSYVEGKYAFIEDGTALPTRTISLLNQPASPPSSLTVTEKTVVINNIARSKLIIDWKPVEGVTQYLVNYKVENGNYVSQVVFSSDFELLDTVKATYTVQVFSYNAALELSTNPAETQFTAVGKTALPETVSGLTIEPINEQFVRLRFTQATAIDVLHGGRVYVRHTNQTGGAATFQAAQDVIEAVAGNTTEVIAPALPGTYLLKFQDDGGRFSATAASVNLSLVDILDSIIVKTDREDTDGTPYNGTKTNVVYDSSLGGLKLIDPTANATGTYDFVDTLDLGATFSLTLKRHFQGVGFYVGDKFDNRTDNIDTWTDFDGSIAQEANAKIAVRTTTDNPSSSPTYTSFNDFANGTFKGRGFQFRITLDTTDTAQNMNLQQAGYTATMPSRTEQSSVIASGTGAKAVTFTAPFFVGTSGLGNLNSFLPSVNISPQNMATGDYFELSSISGTGFTVHFKNSSNASIDRNFTYSAVGFGKGG
jgi:predicted phage tail protein